jgi:hypothetical protein
MCAASVGEALGGVDCGHIARPQNLRQRHRERAGPATHVQRLLARPNPGYPDHLPAKLRTVTADVPVVGFDRCADNGGTQHPSHAQATLYPCVPHFCFRVKAEAVARAAIGYPRFLR